MSAVAVINRARRARESAGLSIGQAAKLLGVDRDDLLRAEELDSAFWDADRKKMADLYGVNEEWLCGETDLRDYAALNAIPGGRDDLLFHDRDILAEFLAALPRRKVQRP